MILLNVLFSASGFVTDCYRYIPICHDYLNENCIINEIINIDLVVLCVGQPCRKIHIREPMVNTRRSK